MLRYAAVSVLLFGGLGLAGGWYFLAEHGPESGLVVEEPNRVLGDVPSGKDREHPIEYRVHNRTRRTLRVVGADYG